MAHKIMTEGTVFDVSGGKTMSGGTVWAVKKGLTMVDGTLREISFLSEITVTITADSSSQLKMGTTIDIDGTVYDETGTWVFDRIGRISVANKGAVNPRIYFNGESVDNPYLFTPETAVVNIHVRRQTAGHTIEITTQ